MAAICGKPTPLVTTSPPPGNHLATAWQLFLTSWRQTHRICHDDTSDHRMDRYSVAEMRCMECGLQQPVGRSCTACASDLARYYCSICHLFDDEPGRDIYHCPFCNVCR